MAAPAQSYSILYSAYLSPTGAVVPAGYAVTKSADGRSFVIATTANLAASSSGTIDGIALTLGNPNDTIQIQEDATVEPSVCPWLGAGSIESAVVDANGKVQRASVAAGILIGSVTKDGAVKLQQSGAIVTSLAGDATGAALANTVVALRNATIPALAGNVGKALVLTALGAFSFLAYGTATSGYDTADHSGGGQEVLSLTGSGGTVLVRSAVPVVFGTSAASVGTIRFPNNATIQFRNASGSGDLRGLWVDASNNFLAGDENYVGVIRGSSVFVQYGASAITGLVISSGGIQVGPSAANGLPVLWGTTPATAGMLRMPVGPSEGGGVASRPLIAVRNPANSANRSILNYYQDSGSFNHEAVEFGTDQTWSYFSGDDCYCGWANWPSGVSHTFFLTTNAGAPPLLWLGDGSAGSLAIATGAGAPAAAYPNGSIYLRNNGTNGTDGFYTRQGGAWYAVGGSLITWADDLNGSTNTSQKVVSITGSAGSCTVHDCTLSIWSGSASISSNARLNFANNQTALGVRNVANSGDQKLVSTDSSGNARFGDGSYVSVVDGSTTIFQGTSRELARADTSGLLTTGASGAEAARMGGFTGFAGLWLGTATASQGFSNYAILGDGSSTFINCPSSDGALRVGNSNKLTWGSTITLSVPLVLQGSNPAASGDIRAAADTTILSARNHANSGDHAVIYTNFDTIVFGTTAASSATKIESYATLTLTSSYFSRVGLQFCSGTSNAQLYLQPSGSGGNNVCIGPGMLMSTNVINITFVTNTSGSGGSDYHTFLGNPTGGGFLFADAGAGKWRGSSGTTTTFGPADPHCPKCGRDFACEWEHADRGEHFAICMPCLLEHLESTGHDGSKFMIHRKLGNAPLSKAA